MNRPLFMVPWGLCLIFVLTSSFASATGNPSGERFQVVQETPETWRIHYEAEAPPTVPWQGNEALVALPHGVQPTLDLVHFEAIVIRQNKPTQHMSGGPAELDSLGLNVDDIITLQTRNFRGIGIGRFIVKNLVGLPDDGVFKDRRIQIKAATFEFQLDLPSNARATGARRLVVDFLRTLVLNDASLEPIVATAQVPASTASVFQPATAEFARMHGPVLKFRVHSEGLHRIAGRELEAAGVELGSIRPGTVQLWIGNNRIPVFVTADGRDFGPADHLMFWLEEPLAEMEPFRTGWLTFKPGTVELEYTVHTAPLPSAATPSETRDWVTFEAWHEEENLFVSRHDDNTLSQSDWFWAKNDSYRTFFTLPCPSMLENSSGTVEVEYFVNKHNDPEGHLEVETARDIDNATAPVQPGKLGQLSQPFPQSILEEGRLHAQLLTYPRNPPRRSAVYLDRAHVRYPRRLEPEVASMEFALEADKLHRLRVHRTESTPVELWSRRDNGFVTRHRPTVSGADEVVYDVRPEPGTRYQLASFKHMEALPVEPDEPSRLSDMDEACDYLILTHPDLNNTDLRRLAEHRRAEGYRVRIVETPQIYDEWNGGEMSSQAIHEFLHHTAAHWPEGGPLYALFVGEANWDVYDRNQTGVANDFPSVYDDKDPKMGNASDDAFVYFDYEDRLPQMVLGRLSPRSAEDLKAIVDKTIEAETHPDWGLWRARSLVIGDQDPHSTEFRDHSLELLEDVSTERYAGSFFDLSAYPFENHNNILARIPQLKIRTSPTATRDVIEEINRGAVQIQYLGHGGVPVWSKARLLLGLNREDSDVRLLENRGRYPFVISWSCLCGRFYLNQPTYDVCIAEEWQRVPGRGSVAMLAPIGSGSSSQHRNLGGWIADRLYDQEEEHLGDASYSAKLAYTIHQSYYLPDQMVFLGDPLAKFTRPAEELELTVTTSDNNSFPSLRVDVAAAELVDGTVVAELADDFGRSSQQLGPWPLRNGTASLEIPLEQISRDATRLLVYAWDARQGRDGAAVMQLVPPVDLEARPLPLNSDGAARVLVQTRAGNLPGPVASRIELTAPGGVRAEDSLTLQPDSASDLVLELPATEGEPRLVRARVRQTYRDGFGEEHAEEHSLFLPVGSIHSATSPWLATVAPCGLTGDILDAAMAGEESRARVAVWSDPDSRSTELCLAIIRGGSDNAELARKRILLDPDNPLTLSEKISWKAMTPGKHALRLEIRSLAGSEEDGEILFETSVPFPVHEPFDLALEDVRFVKDGEPYGKPLEIEARLVNRGHSTARYVGFEAYEGTSESEQDQTEIWPWELMEPAELKPGESRQLHFNVHAYQPIEADQIRLVATTQKSGIPDPRPQDNEVLLDLRTTPDPDLRLVDISVSPSDVYRSPQGTIPVSVTVTNEGEGAAEHFPVRFETRGETWGEELRVERLEAGETRTLSGVLPVRHGDYVLKAMVDPWNAVREPDEDNNNARVEVATRVVLPASEAGWNRTDQGWAFAEASSPWMVHEILNVAPAARGQFLFEPPVPLELGYWRENLVNPDESRTSSEEAISDGVALVQDLRVEIFPKQDIPPLHFQHEVDEGIYRPSLEVVRISPYSSGKLSAFRYRYNNEEPYRQALFGSLTYRIEPVRLDPLEVKDGFFDLFVDDVSDEGWRLQVLAQMKLITTGGRLTSPVVDLGGQTEVMPSARCRIKDRDLSAHVEFRGAEALADLPDAPWQGPGDVPLQGRYFQWRLRVEGESIGTVWLDELQLLETSARRAAAP